MEDGGADPRLHRALLSLWGADRSGVCRAQVKNWADGVGEINII